MLTDSAVLTESLGWLLVLMLAALLPAVRAIRSPGHVGWLIAFCAARLLLTAHELVLSPWATETREFAAILSGMLLWEFARRVWNHGHVPRISAVTHIVALECFALIFAANAAAGWTATLGWLLPITLLVATLPILLGGGAVFLLWRCFENRALRVAAVGLGLYGLGSAAGLVATIGSIAPWLVAGGLAVVSFRVPAIRTRVAFAWLGGLLLAFAVGPLIVASSVRGIDARQQAELLGRAQQAVAALQGRTVARLESEGAPATDARNLIRDHLKQLRRSDALLRDASIWKLRGNRKLTLDLTEGSEGAWIDQREAAAVEAGQAVGLRAFLVRAGERAIVHGPLKAGSLETPVAWLALDYPEAFWTMQRDHARRSGVALIGVLAGFCAMGFVLAGRQAIEGAQRVEIERVQAADKAKTEFLAFLGHELRTPLQTILGRAELLRAQPEAARHAAAIETQGRLLLRLVTDLLDLGTIEAGRFELRPQPFSLRDLIAAIEDGTRPLAEAAGLAFTCTVDSSVADALVGDEMRLRQILGNLLGNAVKYTPQGRVVLEVASEAIAGHAVPLIFRVRDTGPGLPPEKISRLFTLFTRFDSGETFTREGTGVGLALVRRLCSLMGGTVTASNRPEGGAEFVVRLAFPLGAAGAILPSVEAAPTASHHRRILLAEDNTATRELLAEALMAVGHEVVAVADGDAALAAAEARGFDVAVLDINLPRRDGVAVAWQLRTRFRSLRIIGCSAEALPAVRAAALAAGMDELLVKPVRLDALAHAIAGGGAPRPHSDDNVFARLCSTDSTARIHAGLRAEWPRLRLATETAHAAGDADALRKCAHYLQSSALLLGDETLLELCRSLTEGAAAGGDDRARASLDAFEHHFATWSAETEQLVSAPAAPK